MHLLQVMNLIGDVRGKVAVMMDDMIDTAGTLSPRKQFLDWTFFPSSAMDDMSFRLVRNTI